MTKQPRFVTRAGLERLQGRLADQANRVRAETLSLGETAQDHRGEAGNSSSAASTELGLVVAGARAVSAHKDLTDAVIREYPFTSQADTVDYGTRVEYLQNGKLDSMKIVSFADADPLVHDDRTAYESPLAQALIGRKAGDSYQATVNNRVMNFTIQAVYPLTPSDLD